ncbi:uncharacterized protein TrAFT101_011447 [Trichoderma asperellum]|uniref:uncharacterized protein n=1 Tax=Trichoderma asperellum TaxID=101201 RepID=UPI003327F9A2|nr:hypothetical protein TrAFT101_011447 [Trichoderma asperellum]
MSATSSSPPPPLAAESFSPLLPILNAFNHRHHNQHRLAHWWPVFRSLRRTIRNLIDDLSPPSTSLSSRPAARRQASSQSIPPRAIWLNKHFIPRAYVAFSQLAADNQHAPLGLLLIAILSRIHTALSPLLSVDNPITKPQPKTIRSNDLLTNQDKGVAIARQELSLAKTTTPSTSTERLKSSITQSIPDSNEQLQQISKPDRETVKPAKSKLIEASSSSISKDKKKKKKGKGDALSSLFGSLS